MQRVCKNCGACKSLYRGSAGRSWSENGLCCDERDMMTEAGGSCSLWQPRGAAYGFSSRREDTEEDIAALMELLREE